MATLRPSEEYEIKKWSHWFDEALRGKGQESEHGFFMEYAEQDGCDILRQNLNSLPQTDIHIAELACGAARVSINLSSHDNISSVTLFDGALSALNYARSLVPSSILSKFRFVQGSLFSTKLPKNHFDMTWNSGVVEHYSKPEVRAICAEMLRVTKPGGLVIVGIPNRRSFAAFKAFTLGKTSIGKMLNWIPGYRYDTEIPYATSELSALLRDVSKSDVKVSHAGSPLWVTAPAPLVSASGKLGKLLGSSFMTYFVLTKAELIGHACKRDHNTDRNLKTAQWAQNAHRC
jgi:2-polyprenyl-3-methyl-5-hydroxy-6-metoxy-1,4-benzoquinol methylase